LWIGNVSYDDIIEIDDVRDDFLQVPTIFVHFKNGNPPFSDRFRLAFYPRSSIARKIDFRPEGHVRVFADKFRDLDWERPWFEKHNVPYSTDPHQLPDTKSGTPVVED
jgi:hypothetical protein